MILNNKSSEVVLASICVLQSCRHENLETESTEIRLIQRYGDSSIKSKDPRNNKKGNIIVLFFDKMSIKIENGTTGKY